MLDNVGGGGVRKKALAHRGEHCTSGLAIRPHCHKRCDLLSAAAVSLVNLTEYA